MARTAKKPELRQANLSYEQMQEAVPKLERRIAELVELDTYVDSVTSRGDAKIESVEKKLEDLLANIFGADTVEYDRYHWSVCRLDTAPVFIGHGISIDQVKAGFHKGIEKSKTILEGIKSGLLEELGDAGRSTGGKSLKAYEGLELHTAIERAAGKLFKDGHYANAIEDAVKALNALVRLNSGIDDKDGMSLMETVFSPKNPILKFNSLADDSDLDEQKGFMMMFSGAVAGLRNPRAHKIIQDDPEKALEFIAFISLLAKLADKAIK